MKKNLLSLGLLSFVLAVGSLADAATTNVVFFSTTTLAGGTGPVNPVNGSTTFNGAGLAVGDVVVFDGIVANINGTTGDSWGSVNLNAGGFNGVTAAALGVLVRTGISSPANPCALYVNGATGPTFAGTDEVKTNRVRIELTATAAGSTSNMNYLVKIDQGVTGTWTSSLSGSGVNFSANVIALTFGAQNAAEFFMQYIAPGTTLTMNLNGSIQSYVNLANTTATLSGRSELHLTATQNPMPGCLVNLTSPDAWFFLDNIQPTNLIASYLSQIQVNGAAAVADSNVRVVEYAMGTVVIPQAPSFQPLQVFTGNRFTGTATPLNVYTYYTNNSAIASFKLKRGYMATFAQNPDGTGISRDYVAQDGDLQVGVMPASLNGSVSFVRVFPWRWISKKGWAGTPPPIINALWGYDWDNTGTSIRNIEYVPMRWGLYYNTYANINSKLDVTHALGFNEPDNASQANMTVAQAIAEWPNLMASGLRLGSPAPTDGGLDWLYSFIDQADALNYRVDYVAVHFYKCGWTASQLHDWLWAIHLRTHRPVWLTEFNNGATWTSCSVPTLAQNATVIGSFISMMDSAPFVERYAVYNWVGDTRAMVDTNNALTPAGTVYLNEPSPNAYVQEFPSGVGVDANYLFDGDATDRSGSGNDALQAGAPTFTSGHSGQAIRLDGVNDYVQLPANIGQSASFTFAAWVNWNGGAGNQRIFDLGADTNSYLYLTPSSGANTLRFGISTNGNGAEQAITSTVLTSGSWTHVAVTINGTTGKLFVNGTLVASNASMTINPAMVLTKYNYLGKSEFSDPLFAGKLDDVFFAGYALTDAQVAALPTSTPPQFTGDPVIKSGGYVGQAYSDSIASNATNAAGGTLTFSKIDGPAWLTVAAGGALSGTPGTYDLGVNTFTVRVVNSGGAESIARMTIAVAPLTPQAWNPGFELPVTPAYIYNPSRGYWTFSQGSGSGSGVTANGGAFTSGNAVAPEGVQAGFLQAGGTISQTISGFTVGANYTLKFFASQRQNNAQVGQTFDVRINGTVIGSYAPSQSSTNYVESTLNFTASATSQTLSFVGTDLNGGDNTVFLDNVRIIPPAPPVAPTSLSAVASNATVRISWVQSTSPGIAQNKVYRSVSGSSGPYNLLATLSATTAYTDTIVTNGSTYYYAVTAVNTNGESGFSSYIGATPQSPPPAPTGLNAQTLSASAIKLAWIAAAGATSYNVQRATVNGGPYTGIANVTGTAYTNVSLSTNTAYYYVVAGVNAFGQGASSSQASAKTAALITVTNFGFETPVTTTYIYNPTGASWTFTASSGANGSGVTTNKSAFTSNNPPAPQGGQVAFIQGTGSVTQVLSGFISNVNYTVTFSAAQRNYQLNGGQTWNVLADSSVIGSFAPAQTATNYTTYTATFTATAISHTLKFLGTNTHGGDNTILIDNVQVTPP